MPTQEDIIKQLNLKPIEEGGFCRRVYESDLYYTAEQRKLAEAAYYLLPGNQVSLFHRLDCDEIWHFYSGPPLNTYQISPEGKLIETLFGNPLTQSNATPMLVMKKNHWFGAIPVEKDSFTLLGCTTAPVFTSSAYEIGNRENLLTLFPAHQRLIYDLTQKTGE